MAGYGDLVRRAREAANLTPEELASRMGRTKSTIYRIEAEETEPSVEHINALVGELPLSAEALLRAMGVHFNPPSATRLPPALVKELLELDPQDLMVLMRAAKGLRLAHEAGDIQP